jgi:uncharacterized protein (TIGR02246 family)
MQRFASCVNERNLDALMELYEPDAVFISAPGVVHRGLAEIRTSVANGLFALEPKIQTRVLAIHEADDIALVIVEWNLQGKAPNGSEVSQSGKSSDVLRRKPDGSFRVLIDHP